MDENQKLKEKISELENKIKILETDLIHDPLTGLKTRGFFNEEVSKSLATISNIRKSLRREKFGFQNLSILFIDLDHFKKVNDTYGHTAGDTVLKEVAQAIEKSTRVGDIVARWGGEEILISLLGANEKDAEHKAEEIRKNIESLKFDAHPELQVTISIGVANSHGDVPYEDLVKRADEAMYKAKDSGRNKVVAYSAL